MEVLSKYGVDRFKTPILLLAEKSISFYNSVKCDIMSVKKMQRSSRVVIVNMWRESLILRPFLVKCSVRQVEKEAQITNRILCKIMKEISKGLCRINN